MLNSFDDDNDGKFVYNLLKVNNSIGYIPIENVVKINDQYHVVAKSEYTDYPQMENKTFFQLVNEDGDLKLDVSLLSIEAINFIKNIPNKYNNIDTEWVRGAYDYFNQARVNFLNTDHDEYYDELMENYGIIQIDIIQDYTVSYTEKILKKIFSLKIENETSSLVDDMLSDLFGASVKTATNEPKSSMSNEEQMIDQLFDMESDPEFNLNYVKEEIEKPDDNFSFDEYIENLKKRTGKDVLNISHTTPEYLSEHNNFKIITDLIDVIYITSAQELIDCDDVFHANMEHLIETPDEVLGEKVKQFIDTFNDMFINHRECQIKLFGFKEILESEIDFLKSISDKNPNNSNFQNYYKIKVLLYEFFKKIWIYYELINGNLKFNNNKVLPYQVKSYFTILIGLTHTVNKIKLKGENDLYIKEKNLKEFPDDVMSELMRDSLNFDKNTIKQADSYLEDLRNLVIQTLAYISNEDVTL